MSEPNDLHVAATHKVLKYLIVTLGQGIFTALFNLEYFVTRIGPPVRIHVGLSHAIVFP